MNTPDMPPVPQGLREMLKDYPEHIERLEEALHRILDKKMSGADPFERAIWLLEGRLETFISEARGELKVAEDSGDPEAIERAEKKELLMLHSGSIMRRNLTELFQYFEQNKGSF